LKGTQSRPRFGGKDKAALTPQMRREVLSRIRSQIGKGDWCGADPVERGPGLEKKKKCGEGSGPMPGCENESVREGRGLVARTREAKRDSLHTLNQKHL